MFFSFPFHLHAAEKLIFIPVSLHAAENRSQFKIIEYQNMNVVIKVHLLEKMMNLLF